MTETTTRAIKTEPTKLNVLSTAMKWVSALRSGLGKTRQPHSQANNDHRPPYVRMEQALDQVERTRLLQGGLR